MMVLSLNDVSLAYGHRPLMDHVDLKVAAGERICLLGRNGVGKSTLFRLISGCIQPDDGEIWRRDSLRISYLEQEVPATTDHTIFEVVASGLGDLGRVLTEYHNVLHRVGESDAVSLDELSRLQQRIDAVGGWNINQRVDTVLSRLSLPADKRITGCSGGIRRQVMLAQALVSNPDLLLLDEPTNHMDITAITWLEGFLASFQGALMFITHDRTLLKHLATRFIELDRGKLTSFPGDYAYYQRKKEELLEIETRANTKFDKKLAVHEVWIRQGIKARRTRNEGRVKTLQAMRRARSQRQEISGRVSLDVDSSDLSGKRIVDLHHVSFRYDDHWVIRDLSTRIIRKDRIGIIGPNGCGKSTLLRLILGELKPDSGQITMGSRLQIAYFDQQRMRLDANKTVRENVSQGSDHILVRGRSRHVIGYLKDFLFPSERIDSPVSSLSGGERNRLLLAKLFTKPANMMILDEPTNDLDVDTLELLEELLTDFDGTLLLVSHDRTFLDNVVTSTLVFEGDGTVGEYVGGYEDWLRQRKSPLGNEKPASSAPRNDVKRRHRETRHSDGKQKLSYKEQRELDAIPARIEALEQEQQHLTEQASQAEFYQQHRDTITATVDRLQQIQDELEQAYERWADLDARVHSAPVSEIKKP